MTITRSVGPRTESSDSPNYLTIYGVKRFGEVGDVDLLDGLLDNGVKRNMDEWANFSLLEYEKGRFYQVDAPTFTGILVRLRELYECPSERLGEFDHAFNRLRRHTIYDSIQFATNIDLMPKSNPQARDIITHSRGLPIERGLKINAFDIQQLVEGVFGRNAIELYSWWNETPVRLFRADERPERQSRVGAGFGSNSGTGFICYWDSLSAVRTLGVRWHPQKS